MSLRLIEDKVEISVKSNRLLVNDASLRLDELVGLDPNKLEVSVDTLEAVLIMGRLSIGAAIEDEFEKQQTRYRDLQIVRPSMWVAQMGNAAQSEGEGNHVFTQKGLHNGGVVTERSELQPAFYGYWKSVMQSGFVPEVRRVSGGSDGGAWLNLQKPTLGGVLHHWLGHTKTYLEDMLNDISDDDRKVQQENLNAYLDHEEALIDGMPNRLRSHEQIRLKISVAAIKLALGRQESYEDTLDDIVDYIDNDPRFDLSIARAVHNSIFGLSAQHER